MRKNIILLSFLFAVNLVYSQSKEEVTEKFNQFNMELGKFFGKDHTKTIQVLDDIVGYYHTMSQEHKSDTVSFYNQIYFLYCFAYNDLKEYDRAATYVEKLQGNESTQLYHILTNEDFSELRKYILTHDATLTAPELKPGTWGLAQDTPVNPSSATASDEEPGDGAELTIDGYLSVGYHSSYSTNTVFPVELKYTFDQPEVIDYMVYHPRSYGMNGNFQETEVYTCENGKERLIGTFDLKGSNNPSLIDLQGRKPEYIKVLVKSGVNGYACCMEMQFFRRNDKNTIPKVFADQTCSALKKGIKQRDINALTNSTFKSLASALFNNTYDKRYRVQEYKPYPDPATAAKKNKTGTYSLLDNATGIVAMPEEEIVVFVGPTHGQTIKLRSINFNNDYSPTDYFLQEGANSLICREGGLLYVMYHTDNPQARPVKIHIASGKVNGIYRSEKNTQSDWKDILDNAKHTYLDVQGEYAHLIFPVRDFKAYTPDVSQLVAAYDSIVYLESRFTGLEKYKRMNGNRMLFHVSTHPYWMYATDNRTGYSLATMSRICQVDRLRTSEIWGPAHEVGHVNQMAGLKWVGLTEVSNNIYSMYVQASFGNRSRLSEDRLNSEFDGVWNNRYEKGFTQMLGEKTLHSDHQDVFCKLIPFWQLQLYFANVKGYTDFYADIHEQIRNLKDVPAPAQQQLNFMHICCEVTQTDLSEFFERWGMLAVISGEAVDHSSIQNVVNYTQEFILTQEDIDTFKEQVARFPKPEENLWYIHDECIDAFRGDTKNVVVYEIYDGDKLILVTPVSDFTIPETCKSPVVYAVPAVGKPIKVNK